MVAMKESDLCMADTFDAYDKLVDGMLCSSNFWDVVVLTTSDLAQQRVYELEIANKLKQKELPACASYHVIHDPPGPKIGSGGSTMYTLSKIVDLEPEWRIRKILLMHAGGSSQRLPSASVLGKAFTAIPIGNKVYTMFDVKLALCMPFAKRLPPGVFICCPDTFETFTFGNSADLTFNDCKGFIALAHPSPISVGKGHGVYILDDRDHQKDTELLNCKKVLQKPTERQMREEGAVIKPHEVRNSMGSTSNNSQQEYVFTDSQYFFDHSISAKLLKFYHENKPITGEICAYGDFLQPLGCNADSSYINNCKNVMFMSNNLIETRKKVYDLLKGSELNVLALKESKFYHIGTLGEYIESFCESRALQSELGLSRFCYTAYVDRPATESVGVDGCCMHSLINAQCSLAPRCVVEFCRFDAGGVAVQENCIVSNCVYGGSSAITIPQNTFMQTVPVLDPNGKAMYATLLYSVKDDLKAKVSSFKEAHNISYFQRSLMSARVCTSSDELFGEGNPFTLWNAKLFPLSETAESSFSLAVTYVNRLITSKKRCLITAGHACDTDIIAVSDTNGHVANGDAHASNGGNISANGNPNGEPVENGVKCEINSNEPMVLYSFADVIKHKDACRMIDGRNNLSSQIRAALTL